MNTVAPPIERTPLQAGLMFGSLAVVTYLMLLGLFWLQMPSSPSGGDGMHFDLLVPWWLLEKPAGMYWEANPEHQWLFDIQHGYRATIYVAMAINTVFWGLVVGAIAAARRLRNIGRGLPVRPFWRTAAWTLAIATVGFFVSTVAWIPLVLVASLFK